LHGPGLRKDGRMVSLRLEPLSSAHLDHVRAIADEPEVARFTRFPVPVPDGWVDEWYQRYETGRSDGTREAFVAVSEDGTFLGLALTPSINAEEAEMELGYLVAPEMRRQGVGGELLRQLTAWAFDAGAERLVLLIDADNVGSQRVAQAAGYQLEGTMRSTYFKQGQRTDCQIWSRLPSDPSVG